MLIQIRYTDGRHDMVKPQLLERLLDDRRLSGFRRREGWVTIGKDPIRSRQAPGQPGFAGEDRRAAAQR